MRIVATAVLLATGLTAAVVPDGAFAELNKRDFCAATQYCRIPAQFRRGPFLAKPKLHEVSLREIKRLCSSSGHTAIPFGVSNPVIGCARFQGKTCLVYLPKEVRAISEDMFAMVVEHELAHCRGWVHGR